MNQSNHKSAPVERLLEQYYQSPEPSPAFTERLNATLRARAVPAPKPVLLLLAWWQWAAAAALFVLLAGLAIFAMRVRPQLLAGQAPTHTATPAATRTVAPTTAPLLPPSTAAPVSALKVVSPRFCAQVSTAMPDATPAVAGPLLGQPPETQAFAQTIVSGDFRFFITLYCDSRFQNKIVQQPLNEFSEIVGLGLHTVATNQNPDAQQFNIDETAGFVPYETYNGGGSSGYGYSSSIFSGIRFPDDVLIDFSRGDIPLRYIYRVNGSNGVMAGVSLRFTLKAQPDGYFPANISVEPLTAEELLTSQYAAEPLPTISPASLSPILADLRALLDRSERALLDEPGWLHTVTRMENSENGGTLPNGAAIPAAYTMESWYQLGSGRRLQSALVLTHYTPSTNDQVVVYQKGTWVNKTLNTKNASPKESLKTLDSGFYASMVRAARAGESVLKQEHPENGTVEFIIQHKDMRDVILLDAMTGFVRWSEAYQLKPEGWQRWYHMENIVQERVAQPPAEVLGLMGAPMPAYQPLPPAGTPAPAGFDPSRSPLKMRPVAGDDFQQPTFWYGDLFAGEYLLGRVDFGATPGGWCARSADGARIAFQYTDAQKRTVLRWLDMSRVDAVHQPLPDLDVQSALSWSPQGRRLAFSACAPGVRDCGTYLLDTDTGQHRLLSTDFWTPWQILWKPDGSQVALVTSADNQQRLVVLDALTGAAAYTGPANYPNIDPGAPVSGWGVTFPAGATGFGACEAAP